MLVEEAPRGVAPFALAALEPLAHVVELSTGDSGRSTPGSRRETGRDAPFQVFGDRVDNPGQCVHHAPTDE